jgi:hypothetical protein
VKTAAEWQARVDALNDALRRIAAVKHREPDPEDVIVLAEDAIESDRDDAAASLALATTRETVA